MSCPAPTPQHQLLILRNEAMSIGVDPARGGGICWLSKAGGPNLLNEFDCGRFIQQSYYGRDDGSEWNGKPWRWNPVQAGSWQNKPANVISCKEEKPGHLLVEVNPRNWGGQQLCDKVLMRNDITLLPGGDHVHLAATLRYSGTDQHPPRIQELPAVFVARRLSQLVLYEGAQPWQGGACSTKAPGPTNENFRITESWAAWVDPATGEGVGVFSPAAETLTAYRVGGDGSCAACDCSYFAPTMRFAVRPGAELTYHSFITLGSVDHIRKVFSGIRGWCAANKPEWLARPAMMADATPAI